MGTASNQEGSSHSYLQDIKVAQSEKAPTWAKEQFKSAFENLANITSNEGLAQDLEKIKDSKIQSLQDVILVQLALTKLGYNPGNVDGIYKTHSKSESKTILAVKEFQQKNGLTVDGQVGKLTLGKMKELLAATKKVEAPAKTIAPATVIETKPVDTKKTSVPDVKGPVPPPVVPVQKQAVKVPDVPQQVTPTVTIISQTTPIEKPSSEQPLAKETIILKSDQDKVDTLKKRTVFSIEENGAKKAGWEGKKEDPTIAFMKITDEYSLVWGEKDAQGNTRTLYILDQNNVLRSMYTLGSNNSISPFPQKGITFNKIKDISFVPNLPKTTIKVG